MRFRHAVYAVSGLLLASGAIVWSGAQLTPEDASFQVDPADVSDADLAVILPEDTESEEAFQETERPEDAQPEIANEIAPPEVTEPTAPDAKAPDEPVVTDEAQLERLPPRPPLSELAAPQQPVPPEAKVPDEAKSTRLFKPVALSAGTLEAQGYRIQLAGVEPLSADEKCAKDGKEWPCGLQARTAFRSWLRGRAIACVVPPQPDEQLILATCHVGNTDLSEWLVSNGWAKPSADGPFEDAGRKANDTGKGIYGSAPSQGSVNLPRVADPAPMAFPETGTVFEEPEPVIVPDQPPLTGPFPPAPQ